MEYSTCSFCRKQIANKDFDKEIADALYVKKDDEQKRKEARKGQNKQETRQRGNPGKYTETRHIEIYCKACDCYIRSYQL